MCPQEKIDQEVTVMKFVQERLQSQFPKLWLVAQLKGIVLEQIRQIYLELDCYDFD